MGEAESVDRRPKVSNRFELLRKLGAGGFGAVYEAFDREREARVALKTLQLLDALSLFRFKNEFRSLADLVHPNLVRLHELFCLDDTTWYFTMELVEGCNFLEYVRPRPTGISPLSRTFMESSQLAPGLPVAMPPLDPARLRSALGQMTRGVLKLHQAGKIHRDLKPQNVLVGSDDRVVILDFGLIADLAELNTPTMELVGTPAYMSPEQASSKNSGPSSDWYSVGVMLYESLTAQLPYEGSALQMICAKQTKRASDPCPQLPDELHDLGKLSLSLLECQLEKRAGGPQILELVQGKNTPSTIRPRSADPFVGRQSHLAALSSALKHASRQRAVTIRVHGSSGMGKTALLRKFTDQVEERGEAIVLAGRCYECETVPYKALDGLVDAITEHLTRLHEVDAALLMHMDVAAVARLFPVLLRVAPVDQLPNRELDAMLPQQLRELAFAALRRLLGRLAESKPLVVWVDDLQWGDAESAQFFTDFQGPDAPCGILLVTSYRTEEAERSEILRIVLQGDASENASTVRRLEVGPLGAQDGEALAISFLEGDDSGVFRNARGIVRESGGSPFFVRELARYVTLGGGLGLETNDSTAQRLKLQDVLQDRIRRLPETAKSVLELVSVAGRGVSIAVIRQAAGLGGEVREALDLLRMEHYVRTQGLKNSDLVETYHDRIRETVAFGLSKKQLISAHRRLADALQASGTAEPEALVEHFQGAGDFEGAFKYAILAAERAAAAVAFSRAAKLYRLAQELQPGRDTAAIQLKLGEALANAGHGVLAAETYLSTIPSLDSAQALDVRCKAAEQLLRVGHIDEGMRQVEQLLRAAGIAMPRSLWVAVLLLLVRRAFLYVRGLSFRTRHAPDAQALRKLDIGWAVAVGLSNCDVIRGAEIQARTLLLALKTGEPMRVLRCLSLELAFVASGGRTNARRVTALLAAAQNLANVLGTPEAQAWPTVGKVAAAYFQGNWSQAYESVLEAEKLFALSPGTAWERATTSHYRIWSLVYMGKIREMSLLVKIRLREALDRGDLYSATDLRIFTSNLAWLAEDNSREARKHIHEAMDKWSKQGFHLQHYYALFAECNIDLYEGKPSDAWSRVNDNWGKVKNCLLMTVQTVFMEMHHLRARAALSLANRKKQGREDLLRIARADALLLGKQDAPWAHPTRDLILSGIAMLRGDRDKAIDKLGASISGFDSCGMRLHAAAARRRLGEVLGGERGKSLREVADRFMKDEALIRPDRWTELWAPGFSKPEELPISLAITMMG